MINSILHHIGSGILSVLIAVHLVAPLPSNQSTATNNEVSPRSASLTSNEITTFASSTAVSVQKVQKQTQPTQTLRLEPALNSAKFDLEKGGASHTFDQKPSVSAPTAGTYQNSLPPATQTQIAGVRRLCALDPTKVDCNALLNAYNSSASARSSIDMLIQKNEASVQQPKKQTVSECEQVLRDAYAPLMKGISGPQYLSSEASIEEACGDTSAAVSRSQAQSAQISELSSQLQQQKLEQAIQKSMSVPVYTPPVKPSQLNCTTQPYWDLGIIRFKTNCNQVNSY